MAPVVSESASRTHHGAFEFCDGKDDGWYIVRGDQAFGEEMSGISILPQVAAVTYDPAVGVVTSLVAISAPVVSFRGDG